MAAVRKPLPTVGSPDPAVAREDERRRLARDLHDGPAQAMAAALFAVDLAAAALERRPEAAKAELLHAREQVRDALEDVRSAIAGLRPRLLEEQGLVDALQAMAGSPGLWGPQVAVDTGAVTRKDRLPAEIELALFRIAQEAVSNARRHGAADHVRVTLETRPGVVKLAVVDDGRGFDPDRTRAAPERGDGIPGMGERAAQLGGLLRIAAAPGAGTRVEVLLPLPGRGVKTGTGTATREGKP